MTVTVHLINRVPTRKSQSNPDFLHQLVSVDQVGLAGDVEQVSID